MLRGREDELARCRAALDTVVSGTGGGAILVEGEAGMGKTTFVSAALDLAVSRGFAVLHGRGHALGAGVAYGPVASALGRHLHSLAGDDRARLTEGLGSLALLVEGIGDAPAPGDPDLERSRLYQAVALLLGRIGAERPALLCVDDLHWADAASVELLEHLTDELASEQVAILVALRPGDIAGRPDVRHLLATLRRLPTAVRLDIGPLQGCDLAALVADRLGGAPSPSLLAELAERTGGVALAVDAVLRSLADAGGLVDTADGWTSTAPLVVPEYVVELFTDRIRGLPVGARDVIAAIGVADGPLDVEVLSAVAGMSDDAVMAAAGAAVSAGLAREAQPGHWDVGHPLVAEASNGLLGEGERRRLHLAFAQLLVDSGDGELDRCARHVVGAGSLVANDVAADVLGRAGQRALGRGAMDAAARWLSAGAVRATAAGLPPAEIATLLVAAGGAWERRYELEAALAAHAQAVDLLASTDPGAAAMSGVTAARLCWQLGRADVDFWSERALELAHVAPPPERLRVHYDHLGAQLRQGRIADAARAAAMVRDDLVEAPDGTLADVAAFRLLSQEVFVGHLPSEQLVESAPVLPPDTPLDLVVNVEGPVLDALVALGRWTEARQRADELLERVGPDVTVSGLSWRAFITRIHGAVATGRWAEASDLMTELLGDAPVVAASRAFWVGALAALRGDFEVGRIAVTEARQAIAPGVLRPHASALMVVAAYIDLVAGDAVDDSTAVIERSAYNAMNHVLVSAMAAEVSLAAGDVGAANTVVVDLRSRGGPGTLPVVVAGRIAALISGDGTRLVLAGDAFDGLGMPFEAARARLEALERGAAGPDPDAVLDVLHRLGAEPWAARARAFAGPRDAVPPTPPPRELLTPREREVAFLVAEGRTNAQVAEQLTISIRTVTSHLDHAYTKLGISSRAALASYVLRDAATTAPST